jgi:hypothetical protein
MIRLYVRSHGFQAVARAAKVRWTSLKNVVDGDWLPGPKMLDYFGLKKIADGQYAPDVEGLF